MIIFAFPINAQFVSDSDTLALWHMDEGLGLTSTDSSGNSRTLLVSADWTAAGKFGKGLHLNQLTTAVASLQNNPINFPANTPFAIDGFVKLNKNANTRLIFNYFKPSESFSRVIQIAVLSDGSIRCDLRADAQAGSPSLQQVFGRSIDDSQWHRITCTRSIGNTRLLLYLDNILEYNATGHDGTVGAISDMQLSFSRAIPNEGIDGEIDEWRILNRTVYPQESDHFGTTIQGMKFEDVDGDGIRDVGESRVEGWTIFLDTDDDNVLDADEMNTVTDINGYYEFTHLLPGTYRIREVQESGWTQTTPNPDLITLDGSIKQITGVNFGNQNIADKKVCNCTNITQKVEELKQRFNELEIKLNNSDNRINELEIILGNAETKLNDSENKISDLESRLDDTENKVSDFEMRLGNAEGKISDLENNLESGLNTTNNRVTAVENELDATNNKLNLLENNLNNTNNSFNNLKSRIDVVFGYLKNLLLPIKKEMVCGYMKDNSLTKHEALGLKCNISRNNCICSIA